MNILIPDVWLRMFLKTAATPEQIKEKLSLSGPSIERIYGEGKECVYDIEVTGNRPDMMSVVGIAREAAAILPRFGIKAVLSGDPYTTRTTFPKQTAQLPLTLQTDPELNPRWMSVIFDSVTVKQSPTWLSNVLSLAGMRSINNVVDITNYLMRAYGQPAHVFDYDEIHGHYMKLRASKKGETLVTLDGKSHTLPGDDIVIEDKSGTLIDLCGIMGGENSSVTERTRRVILFLQTYSARHIRKTSMALAHRTEAAGLFEKNLDTELVKPVFSEGLKMMVEITGGTVASDITDLYPQPYKPKYVSVSLTKLRSYIGDIPQKEIKTSLTTLGFSPKISPSTISVRVPSFRRDVSLDVDIIEEVARIYGYHAIPPRLPDNAPPIRMPDPQLVWEKEIRTRLRDWGYIELITYSMISEESMHAFGADVQHAYRIQNPLSNEWVFMRPNLSMSMLPVLKENLKISNSLRLFEIGMTYEYREGDLPNEIPTLVILWNGTAFREAKGVAESLFSLGGIPFPEGDSSGIADISYYDPVHLSLGKYGSVGLVKRSVLIALGIRTPVTMLSLSLKHFTQHATTNKVYVQVPKYPPMVEDLSFVVPQGFRIGPLLTALQNAHPLVNNVSLLDVHKETRTVHVVYQDRTRNLTSDDVAPARNKLIEVATRKFGIHLKSQ